MVPIWSAFPSLLRTNRVTLFLITLLLSIVFEARGEIRCYCNLPVCVSTGYMCKSARDTCFTEHFAFSSDLAQSRHGCAELLSRHIGGRGGATSSKGASSSSPCSRLQRRRTNDVLPPEVNRMTSSDTRSNPQSEPLTGSGDIFPSLFCCQEDMCNYVNAMDIHVQVQAKSNHTHHGVFYNNAKPGYPNGSQPGEGVVFGNQDLWFKAAVIAVPIAGSFVLLLLILLAAHMLKQDSKRQRRLSEMRRQRQYKTRLLLSEAYAEKTDHHQPFQYAGHYGEMGGNSGTYATDYLVSAKKGESNYQDFVYERPVSVSLCGSFFPLTRWDSNYKSPAFV